MRSSSRRSFITRQTATGSFPGSLYRLRSLSAVSAAAKTEEEIGARRVVYLFSGTPSSCQRIVVHGKQVNDPSGPDFKRPDWTRSKRNCYYQGMPHEQLQFEQSRTLSSPRRRYGILARALFFTLDLFYGRPRTLSKFKVLEVIARVPYQA